MGTMGAGEEKEGWGKGEEGGIPGWGKEIGGGDRNDKRRVWGTAVQRSAKTSEGRWGVGLALLLVAIIHPLVNLLKL